MHLSEFLDYEVFEAKIKIIDFHIRCSYKNSKSSNEASMIELKHVVMG